MLELTVNWLILTKYFLIHIHGQITQLINWLNMASLGIGNVLSIYRSAWLLANEQLFFPFMSVISLLFGSLFQSDPPFACGAVFDGSLDGYIDLGPWSPGPRYTIAAWVRPAVADRARRVIVLNTVFKNW